MHAPDQVESAGEVAAMFADDVPALQKLLRKKYDACLPPAHMPCFARVPSTGEEIHGLIGGIETTLFSSAPLAAFEVDNPTFASHLQTLILPGSRRSTLVSGGGARDLGMDDGFLDAIREKVELIAECLPLRLIPTDSLLELISRTRSQELGQQCQVQNAATPVSRAPRTPSPVLYAMLTECDVLNRLLETVHESLRQLDMALLRNSPLGGSKTHAKACAEDLIAGQVPAEWSSSSFPSTKSLATWMRNISESRLPQVHESFLA